MGWLENLFKPKAKNKGTFNSMVSMKGYEPNFTAFGKQVLYSDIILSSLRMKQRFFAKVEPRHVRYEDGKKFLITDSSISKVLRRPNEYQTTYDFLSQAYFMREKDNTCYIYLDYYINNNNQKVFTGMYTLIPRDKPEVQQDEKGNLFIIFYFNNYNEPVIFPLNEIAIWKNNIEDNQYIGGGSYSASANNDLLSSLEAYHQNKQTITEAAKLGCTFDGIVKISGYGADHEKVQKIRDKFLEDLRKNKGGVGVLDNGAEYQAIQRQLKLVDATTQKEIKENILIHVGMSIETLMGDLTTERKNALHDNHIEPAAISLGQALSKVFFSDWQTSHGDMVELYTHKTHLMSIEETNTMVANTLAAGIFMKDEIRSFYGMEPLPNGAGQVMPRGYNNLDETDDVGGGENA